MGLFPVAGFGDVVVVTEELRVFFPQHLGHFLDRPDVVLAFHPFAVGIAGGIESAFRRAATSSSSGGSRGSQPISEPLS